MTQFWNEWNSATDPEIHQFTRGPVLRLLLFFIALHFHFPAPFPRNHFFL